MEKNQAGKFLGLPHTRLGLWAVILAALFVVIFISKASEFLPLPAMLIMAFGVAAGILTLVALIWKRERSWLLWLSLLPGMFAILFTIGELLYPH